jgi:hypothetical protein
LTYARLGAIIAGAGHGPLIHTYTSAFQSERSAFALTGQQKPIVPGDEEEDDGHGDYPDDERRRCRAAV